MFFKLFWYKVFIDCEAKRTMMMVLGSYLSSQIEVFENVWSHRCRNKKTVTTVEYLLCCFLRLF